MRGLAVAAALTLSGLALSPQVALAQGVNRNWQQDYQSIAGSRWTGQFTFEGDTPVEWTVDFRPGGVMTYAYGGTSYDNGRWIQNNGLVAFDLNDNFVVYVGALSDDGRRLKGHMVNRRGQPGLFEFTRGR